MEQKKEDETNFGFASRSIVNEIYEPYDPSTYFFNFLTIRAGSAISSIITATLMITVILQIPMKDNYLIESKYKAVQYIFIYGYLITNLLSNMGLIYAVGSLNFKHLRCGILAAMSCFFYWMILTVISFIPKDDAFRFVCFENNCPEIHWLYDTKWRNYGIKCPFDKNISRINSTFTGCENYAEGPMSKSILLGLIWFLFTVYSFRTLKKLEYVLHWEYIKSSQ